MNDTVIKSSGQAEKFDTKKLATSLVRSGAPSEVAYDIAREVKKQVRPYDKTKDIYRLARRLLKKYNRAIGMRYSLKKALFSLGPSGYPFEKYMARILKGYGYSVEVGRVIEGYCVSHEVDVIAVNGSDHCIIECKYHRDGGKATDVKVALYIHSRFVDIQRAFKQNPEYANLTQQGWLVTNTRCTTEAIQFAECAGLKIVSWRYPEEESLEKMIEQKRLYPVTILPSARKKPLETLFRNDIILAQDIADMDEKGFIRKSGLDAGTARRLKRQADELCPCTR